MYHVTEALVAIEIPKSFRQMTNSISRLSFRGNLRISIPIFQDDYTVVAKNAIKKSALCEYFTYQPLVQDI